MLAWLTETTVGQLLQTFMISMVPVAELRAGIPYGISLGLDAPAATLAAILGNLFPVPMIIIYVRQIFGWLRKKSRRVDGWISRLEQNAEQKGEKVRRYGALGLVLLVAIPLPGTGAWTGALVAAVLGLRTREAILPIFCGVLIAAGIVLGLTLGVIHLF